MLSVKSVRIIIYVTKKSYRKYNDNLSKNSKQVIFSDLFVSLNLNKKNTFFVKQEVGSVYFMQVSN